MNGSFYTAITGAKSHQIAVDGTAHNIANINTTGYKASITEFGTLFEKFLAVNAQTQTSNQGTGVRVNATAIDMKAGVYQQTDSIFDLALDGDGFFGVIGSNTLDAKQVAYTRNGTFGKDENAMLVNQNGNYVLGTSYGNLISVDGRWQVDPTTKAGGLSNIENQGKLFVPDDLFYPAVATKKATLSGNIVANENTKTVAANKETPLSALYDRNGVPMNITDGENLLIATGSENLEANASGITLTKTITDGFASPMSFVLNGATISVSFDDTATNEEKAEALADAINASGVATARTDQNKLQIGAESLELTNSNYFSDTTAKIITVGKEIKTLGDLKNEIDSLISGGYADISADGSIKVASNSSVAFQFANAGNSNNALLFALESMSGFENTAMSSLGFREARTTNTQTIVTPDGEKVYLTSTLKQIGENSYEAITKIRELGSTNAKTALSDIAISSQALDLTGGENMWFAAGKQPAQTDYGYGYSLDIKNFGITTNPNISFDLDGASYSFTAPSGMSEVEFRTLISNALANAGYETSRANDTLVIFPKSDQMVLTNGSTNINSLDVSAMSLGKITYPDQSNIGDMANRLQEILTPLSATASFENSQFKLQNNSNRALQSFLLDGTNTPSGFRAILNNLNTSIEPNSKAYSSKLEALTTLAVSSGNMVSFDENGKMVGDSKITLDNGGEKLEFTLDLTNYQSTKPATSITADGVIEGKFDGYTVGNDGEIIATFDNARTAIVGQVAIYHFANNQGLMRIGDTMFMQSDNSGEAHFWTDQDGNIITGASVHNLMLEGSNVQGAVALTDLIIYQRAYEGNAKAVTTSDELIKNAINMKR